MGWTFAAKIGGGKEEKHIGPKGLGKESRHIVKKGNPRNIDCGKAEG